MVFIWITSCTVANDGSIVPLHEATLVGKDCVGGYPISDQDGLEGVLLQNMRVSKVL